jgi:hypothetical protein
MHDYIDSALMSRLAILNYCNLLDLQLLRHWNLQHHLDSQLAIGHILRLIVADSCFHRLDAGLPMLQRGIALRGIRIGEARNPGPPYENDQHTSEEAFADCNSQDNVFAECRSQDAEISDAAFAQLAADLEPEYEVEAAGADALGGISPIIRNSPAIGMSISHLRERDLDFTSLFRDARPSDQH